MLAKIKGIIDYKEDDFVIVDVNGIGYEVFVPASLIESLQEGESTTLYLQTVVKEDSITLYGFSTSIEKKFFNLVTTVQGIGPKIAIAMLGKFPAEQFIQAIMLQDDAVLKSIPGIGAKVAQRVINELKDKVSKIPSVNIDVTQSTISATINNRQDAILALQGLGYTYFEITNALKQLKDKIPEDMTTEGIIKEVLLYFSGGSSNG